VSAAASPVAKPAVPFPAAGAPSTSASSAKRSPPAPKKRVEPFKPGHSGETRRPLEPSQKATSAKATASASRKLIELYRKDGWAKTCPAGLPDLPEIA
jgi:hypothetical protein